MTLFLWAELWGSSVLPYCCYVLWSSTKPRAYTGITTDLGRRLRQHNRELRGGARATRTGGPWRVLCLVLWLQGLCKMLQITLKQSQMEDRCRYWYCYVHSFVYYMRIVGHHSPTYHWNPTIAQVEISLLLSCQATSQNRRRWPKVSNIQSWSISSELLRPNRRRQLCCIQVFHSARFQFYKLIAETVQHHLNTSHCVKVQGFPSKIDACRFEWRVKRQRATTSRKLVPMTVPWIQPRKTGERQILFPLGALTQWFCLGVKLDCSVVEAILWKFLLWNFLFPRFLFKSATSQWHLPLADWEMSTKQIAIVGSSFQVELREIKYSTPAFTIPPKNSAAAELWLKTVWCRVSCVMLITSPSVDADSS